MANFGLQIKVDGQWLRPYGAWGDLTYSFSWPGGPKEASWEMSTRFGARIPLLRRWASVQIAWGGWIIWSGYLSEPDWNGTTVSLTANGLFRKGEQYTAFTDTAGSSSTTNIVTAVNAAPGIGWTVDPGVPNGDYPSGLTQPLNSISDLVEAHAQWRGQRWQVDQFGLLTMTADPIVPTYLIRAGSGDLGIAEDNYASHVAVRHVTTVGGYRTAVFPSPLRGGTPNAYEARFGHREAILDATSKGPLSNTDADSLAQQVYQRTYQRPGWTNGLQLGHGEILTTGWKPIHPALVRPNMMARLLGVPDEVGLTSYTDFVIGETQYKDGEDQVTVNPVGLVSRSQEDVLTELLEAMFPDEAA